MSARDMAINAYKQALAAAKAEELRKAEEEAERERTKREYHRQIFESALPVLNEWFPGVAWDFEIAGDFRHDTIVFDADENQYPPSFKLKVDRRLVDMNDVGGGYRIDIEVGDYSPDTSMPGYSYFSGRKVHSAADIGRYLESRNK